MKPIKPGFHTPAAFGNDGGGWSVAHNDDITLVRDSKDQGSGPALEFGRAQWLELIKAVNAEQWPVWVKPLDGGAAQVRMPDSAGPFLMFDQHEMDMFAKSVRDGDHQMIGPQDR